MIRRIIPIVFIAAMLVQACKPEPKGELGTPGSKIAGMEGTWRITTFTQQDLNNPIKETRDLSEFYVVDGVDPLSITFKTSDMTYTVQPGPGKNYFGTSGTWGFDNPDFPSYLKLYTSTDTMQFDLGAVVHTYDNDLSIQLPRSCDDGSGNVTNTVIYSFNFNRVQ